MIIPQKFPKNIPYRYLLLKGETLVLQGGYLMKILQFQLRHLQRRDMSSQAGPEHPSQAIQ